MVFLTAPGGGTSEGYNAISGQTTQPSSVGPPTNVQTGTVQETLPNGQTYQTAVYAPAPPYYDYVNGDGTVTTAYGTAPPYYDGSGHINSLYGGDAQSSSNSSVVGTTPGSPGTGVATATSGCAFCTDPVGYLTTETFGGIPLYLLLAGALVLLLLVAVVL